MIQKSLKNILYFSIFFCLISFSLHFVPYLAAEYKINKFQQNISAVVASNKNNIFINTNNLNKNGESDKLSSDSIKKEIDNKAKKENTNYDILFRFALERIKMGYVEEIKDKDLYENAINGMLTSLDPHSSYLKPDEFKEMQVQTKGEFGGLGIEVTKEFSLIKIIAPIEGTPAEKAGILPGDYITQIDDKSVIDLSLQDAVSLMRGKIGGKIKLTILRKGESKPLNFTLKREIISVKAARGERQNNIIYVKINSFTEKTHQDVLNIITKQEKEIKTEKVKGIILDLRNNPGGLLDQSIKISELFLDYDKVIVSIKGKNDVILEEYKSKNKKPFFKDKPMVVLVNEGSASASEIVSGALQDNKRAIILGTKTFGKGSVQNVMPLPMGGAIKMTIARYYTPLGISIQAKGIEPDIIVENNKIEIIKEDNLFNTNENNLKGHLENKQKDQDDDLLSINIKNNLKKQETNKDLYKKDFQLARAVDLILALNIFGVDK